MKKKRVAVGLSGGVDSAVTASLLKEQGYEVVGVHLYCWPPESEIEKDEMTREEWIKKHGCRADEDRKAALKTALEIGIPFKVLDFSEEYKEKVIDYFYREYKRGRTPNPDVMCNSEIKFGLFLQWALGQGFDYVATGHYARLDSGRAEMTEIKAGHPRDPVNFGPHIAGWLRAKIKRPLCLPTMKEKGVDFRGGRVKKLMIPKDKHKDQTYFLWKLGQRELGKVLFPLGDYLKSEVRELAKKAGLSVADRPDSQGICFVGKVRLRDFLKKRLKEKKGKVLDVEGRVIGEHDGVWFYTIGQRGGWRRNNKIQIPRYKHAALPLYVINRDAEKNELIVGESKDALRRSFKVGEVNWISGFNLQGASLKVRIRHGGELIPAKINCLQGCTLKVRVEEGQRGVAPGQAAVFYSETGECLGGGVIE